MDQRFIAAHHEAGHVVMRDHYGLKTPSFVINEDGTGFTAPSSDLIFNLEVQIDIALAGSVAEDLLLSQGLSPTLEDVEDAVNSLSCGHEIDLDLEDAIYSIQLRHPKWSNNTVLTAIRESHDRCVATLKRKWSIVEQLAAEALQSPRGAVYEETIDRLCTSAAAN